MFEHESAHDLLAELPAPAPAGSGPRRGMSPRAADVSPTARHRLPDNVVVRTLVLQTVVLNLETGQYHGLNPTAGSILELLGSGMSVIEVAERLATQTRHSRAEVTEAVRKTCAALLARQLLEVDASSRARRAA
jgi:hypothetical protein